MNLPKSLESERAVLGALILESSHFDVIKDILCPADFFLREHSLIYKVMFELRSKYISFNFDLVAENLPILEKYIYEMAEETASTKNIVSYANIVREKSVQRQLITIAKEMF